MSISLKNLIEVSPFDTATRNQLLEKLETLTDDQKFRLSGACWQALSRQFQARYKAKVAQTILDISEGKTTATKEDLAKIESDMYLEFAALLKSGQTEEEVSQIRQEIKKFMPENTTSQPVPQPQSKPDGQTQ